MNGDARSRQSIVHISDPSGVAEARRAGAALARLAGLDESVSGELAVAITEAATNIAKHAGEGVVLARALSRGADDALGIEVLAVDKGPGMANIAQNMRDGHSTAGTPGSGLGALNRMTSDLEIWSRPGAGTLLRFEVWPRGRAAEPARRPAADVAGAVCVAKSGEPVSGDGWAILQGRGRLVVLLVDGLGHGPEAHAAAQAAVVTAEEHPQLGAADLMSALHDALRPTRGAAAAVAMLEAERELCTFCGIGNISALVRAGGTTRSMVSHNGTLGHQVRKVQEFQYPFPKGALLVMHSDGIATHWDLASYPGLEARHPGLAAAALFRDHHRGRDDATVLALRNGMNG